MITILEIRNRPPLHRGSCHGEQPHRAKTRPPHRSAARINLAHLIRCAMRPIPQSGITSRALGKGRVLAR